MNKNYFLLLLLSTIPFFHTSSAKRKQHKKNPPEKHTLTFKSVVPETSYELVQKLLLETLDNLENNKNGIALELLNTAIAELYPQEKRIVILKNRCEEYAQYLEEKLKTRPPEVQKKPLLSFIIPCYNRETCIETCIDSIYKQNLQVAFEVIAVDDDSKDGSFKILSSYEKKYPNFFAFKNPKNRGAAITRNNAIAYARGTIICNADSDDFFEENSLQPIIDTICDRQLDLIFFEKTNFFYDSPNNLLYQASTTPEGNVITLDTLFYEDCFATNSGNRFFTKNCWLKSGGFVETEGLDTWTFSFKQLVNGFIGHVYPGSYYFAKVWRDKSSKWWLDQKRRLDDISPFIALHENPEIFTQSALEMLKNYSSTGVGLVQLLNNTDLKLDRSLLIPKNQLDLLMHAYAYENQEAYELAFNYYLDLLNTDLHHKIIFCRAARIALLTDHANIAQEFIKKALTCPNT